MGLIIFAIMTWLLISIYTVLPLKTQKRESVFLYMLLLVISINTTWIVAEELHWITVSHKVPLYLAFLLIRSIIVPYCVLLFLNLLLTYRSRWSKGFVLYGFLLTFLMIDLVALSMNVISYNKWNLCYSAVNGFALFLVAVGMLQWYRKVF